MTESADSKPVVLIFKETLLPVSETFIEAQSRQLSKFAARYIGLGHAIPSLDVPLDSILMTSGLSSFSQLAQKLYRHIGVAPIFHRRAKAARAALIHAHFASGGRSALPLAKCLRIPLVVTLHGSDVTKRINFRHQYEHLWNNAALFLCVSDFIRQKAIEAGFPEDKLLVHYIGIDREIFRPAGGSRQPGLVLFVGRLVQKKGCAFLLNAMVEVNKAYPSAETVIIGDGPLRPSLEDLAKHLGIAHRFLGSQPSSIVRAWMSKAAVLCTPSVSAADGDSEGLPTVIVEAQATGMPVVATFHAGIPEVVLDGQTGLLAPERDAEALAHCILRLLTDKPFWTQCVDKGTEFIQKRFDLKTQTRQLETIYSQICRDREESISDSGAAKQISQQF